jgi:Beta-lactamase class C and other penicillin binding proteins
VKKIAVIALLATLLAPVCAADSFDPIRASIRKQLVDQAVPSLAVAVVKDGKIVWEEGFGWANREKRVAATPHTMYSLASISKPITATGLMLLVKNGKLDLDRPVNDYLGRAKLRARVGDAADATVRRVANHSSGLPLHYQFFYSDEPYRRPPMEETISRYGNLVTIPGEKYQYSNLGYGILDYIISRLSGRSFEEYLRVEVFQPLGMTRTSVGIDPGLEPYAAERYGVDGLPIPFYDFDHPGGSAIYSSAHDLALFALFHLKAHLPEQKAILSDEMIDAMHEFTVKTGKNSGYGIGFAIEDLPGGGRIVSHTGGMGGVATTMRLVTSERLGIVVLCNASTSLPHRIADEILQLMLPRLKLPARGSSPKLESFSPPPELVGTWKGALHTYKEELPFTLRILESGDIHAQLADQLKTLLNSVQFEDGYLTGRMNGDIGTEDANRRPYVLSLSLKLRGDILNGAASAISLPGKRVGNALTQWVELKKEP